MIGLCPRKFASLVPSFHLFAESINIEIMQLYCKYKRKFDVTANYLWRIQLGTFNVLALMRCKCIKEKAKIRVELLLRLHSAGVYTNPIKSIILNPHFLKIYR